MTSKVLICRLQTKIKTKVFCVRSFFLKSIVKIKYFLIYLYFSFTIYSLRVHTEISWSDSTIRGSVYNGTSQ